MIKLLLEPVNFLILDEPTNHLDMKTKDILKQAIKDFDGTVILVSHDREFLDGLVEKVYEFGGGQVKEMLGGIYDFLEKKRIASLRELELSKSVETNTLKAKPENTKSAEESKQTSRRRNLAMLNNVSEKRYFAKPKKVEEAEAEIARIEATLKSIEDEIANNSGDQDIYNRHAETTKALENAMSIWELASMELDELQS